jgi:mannose-6-phosphate isomerase-like protein (cupin superfamily)
MKGSERFRFDSQRLEPTVAHDGVGRIRFRRASTRDDGRAYDFLDFTVVPPGVSIGLHTHGLDNEEIYVVLAGRAEMTLDDATFEVTAGDVVVNRPGGTHGLRNDGPEDVRLVVLQLPASSWVREG